MLQQNPWYWGSIRKVVAAFGTVFSDIHIIRVDSAGNPTKTLMIPCEYGPKEKWLVINIQNPMPGVDDQPEMLLPRMSYEVTGMVYDEVRKLTTTGKTVKALVNANGTLRTQFNPVPYNIGFQLNVMAKTLTDGLMIIEQILPFFTPDYTISVNDVPELGLTKDIPIVLNGVQHDDTWDGAPVERRTITWALSFTARAYLYPPSLLQTIVLDSETQLLVSGSQTVVSTQSVTAMVLILPSAVTLFANQSKLFTAAIVNAPTTDYTFSLSPNIGTTVISGPNLTYTAPVVSTQTTVTLTITSTDDTTKSSSAIITVIP